MKHPPSSKANRVLTKSPWEIATIVAHNEISYGTMIEGLENGHVLPMLKRAIFTAVPSQAGRKIKLTHYRDGT